MSLNARIDSMNLNGSICWFLLTTAWMLMLSDCSVPANINRFKIYNVCDDNASQTPCYKHVQCDNKSMGALTTVPVEDVLVLVERNPMPQPSRSQSNITVRWKPPVGVTVFMLIIKPAVELVELVKNNPGCCQRPEDWNVTDDPTCLNFIVPDTKALLVDQEYEYRVVGQKTGYYHVLLQTIPTNTKYLLSTSHSWNMIPQWFVNIKQKCFEDYNHNKRDSPCSNSCDGWVFDLAVRIIYEKPKNQAGPKNNGIAADGICVPRITITFQFAQTMNFNYRASVQLYDTDNTEEEFEAKEMQQDSSLSHGIVTFENIDSAKTYMIGVSGTDLTEQMQLMLFPLCPGCGCIKSRIPVVIHNVSLTDCTLYPPAITAFHIIAVVFGVVGCLIILFIVTLICCCSREIRRLVLRERKKVLIVYSPDCDEHVNVVKKFVAFLERHCKLDATVDYRDEDRMVTSRSEYIMRSFYSAEKILLIMSDGIRQHFASESPLANDDLNADPARQIFAHYVHFIRQHYVDCLGSKDKLIVARFCYTERNDRLDQKIGCKKPLCLMEEIGSLVLQLHDEPSTDGASFVGRSCCGSVTARYLAPVPPFGSRYVNCHEGTALEDAIEIIIMSQRSTKPARVGPTRCNSDDMIDIEDFGGRRPSLESSLSADTQLIDLHVTAAPREDNFSSDEAMSEFERRFNRSYDSNLNQAVRYGEWHSSLQPLT